MRQSTQMAEQIARLWQEGDSCEKVQDYIGTIAKYEKAYRSSVELADSSYILYSASHLYHAYFVTGNAEEASKFETILIEGYNKYINQTITIDRDVLMIISSQVANILVHKGRYQDAINLRMFLCGLEKDIYGEKDIRRFANLYSLASLYLDVGNSDDALDNIQEAIQKIDYTGTENYKLDIELLKVVALLDLGKIGGAIDLCEMLRIHYHDNESFQYQILHTYSFVVASTGDFKKSLELLEELLPLTAKIYGKESSYYATDLLNLSEMFALNDYKEDALVTCKKALSLMEAIYGKKSLDYYKAYAKLASRYASIDNAKYKEMREQCIALAKDIFGEQSKEYANALIYSVDLQDVQANIGIQRIENGLEIKRQIGQTYDHEYISQLSCLPILYREQNNWEKVYEVDSSILKLGKDYVIRNFANLRENQRENLWNMIKSSFDGIAYDAEQYTYYAIETKDYSLYNSFSGLAFDSRLFYKGLLLSSTTTLDRLLSSSDDENIRSSYNDILSLTQDLSQCVDVEKQNEINNKLEEKERELLHWVSSTYGIFIGNFVNYDWHNVQEALKPNEIGLEFFSFPVGKDGDVQYAAAWVGAEGFPMFFSLFIESELSKVYDADEKIFNYKDPTIYKCVWRVLEQFKDIKEAQTIYFSTEGILNSIAIENVADSNNVLANDKWRLVRVSSTRELINKRGNSSAENKAALFGGLNYDMGLEDLVTENRKFKVSTSVTHLRGADIKRYGVENLPYTLKEVEEIGLLLKQHNFSQYKLITGNNGTEEELRSLSGQPVNVLHLATHGFFWDDEMVTHRSNIPFLNASNNPKQSSEQRAMLHSGLLLSGANYSLKGKELPSNVEDGIMTAQELSKLDFNSVDMAVLSACQTGLGLVNGEGVFGLQRGFKLAGTGSLLMSLWEVSDEATALLMTEFYKNYLNGETKIDSLKAAQKKLRDTKIFAEPEYWAGWILLDALN